MIDDRLLKIVALAKHGIGGERDAAIAAVKRACTAAGLDFATVMEEPPETREYVLPVHWRTKGEFELLGQVCFKFALYDGGNLGYNSMRKVYIYDTTAAKHAETTHAATVLLTAYRRQLKRMVGDFGRAFISKHDLFRPAANTTRKPKTEDDDPGAAWRAAQLMGAIDRVPIHKTIGAGK